MAKVTSERASKLAEKLKGSAPAKPSSSPKGGEQRATAATVPPKGKTDVSKAPAQRGGDISAGAHAAAEAAGLYDAPQAPASLAALSKMAMDAFEQQRLIDEMEEVLRSHKEALNGILLNEIPKAMGSVGMSEYKLEDGSKVTIKDFINGTLPKEDEPRRAAFAWLEKNEAGDLIKTTIDVALGKGETKTADKIEQMLVKLKVGFARKEDVHPQTLYAFAREKMEAGEKLPLELLGLKIGRVAKLNPAKGKK